MPEENKDFFVSTTLMIVILTTIIGGSLTEPVLTKMGMRADGQSSLGHDLETEMNSLLDSIEHSNHSSHNSSVSTSPVGSPSTNNSIKKEVSV